MNRARLVAGSASLLGALSACSFVLGLQDRSLAPEASDAQSDASNDASAESASCQGTFCECHPHDFCEDFDRYDADGGWREAIVKRWTNSLQYPNPLELGGDLSLISAGTASNAAKIALESRTTIGSSSLKVAAGLLIGQVDGSKRPQRIQQIDVSWLMRVESLGVADGGVSLLDGGPALATVSLALVSADSQSDGVGVMLSEQGAAIGYALHVSSVFNASLAQGIPFSTSPVATVGAYFLPYRVRVAHVSVIKSSGLQCAYGTELALDGGTSDAGSLADPLAVVVFPPPAFGNPTCEILGGSLAGDEWIQKPILALGSVQTGQGEVRVAFDNVTLDFDSK